MMGQALNRNHTCTYQQIFCRKKSCERELHVSRSSYIWHCLSPLLVFFCCLFVFFLLFFFMVVRFCNFADYILIHSEKIFKLCSWFNARLTYRQTHKKTELHCIQNFMLKLQLIPIIMSFVTDWLDDCMTDNLSKCRTNKIYFCSQTDVQTNTKSNEMLITIMFCNEI